jgi:hypothetical protein
VNPRISCKPKLVEAIRCARSHPGAPFGLLDEGCVEITYRDPFVSLQDDRSRSLCLAKQASGRITNRWPDIEVPMPTSFTPSS